jgi:hypothetical protein
MYFGEDSGIQSANNAAAVASNTNRTVKQIIEQAMTGLSETNCLYNGTSIVDFNRANFNKE